MCGRTRRSEICAFVSGELAGWIENMRLRGPHTHPTALGYSERYTLLSHCTLPHRKLKPSMSEDVRLFQETLNPFPEVLSILHPGFEQVT